MKLYNFFLQSGRIGTTVLRWTPLVHKTDPPPPPIHPVVHVSELLYSQWIINKVITILKCVMLPVTCMQHNKNESGALKLVNMKNIVSQLISLYSARHHLSYFMREGASTFP